MHLFARGVDQVKDELKRSACEAIDAAFADDLGESRLTDLEKSTVFVVGEFGRKLLSSVLAMACRAIAETDIKRRCLRPGEWRFRLDESYWAQLSTPLGLVEFPWFAYRSGPRRRGGRPRMRNPARERLVSYYGLCRSSPMCLEWETRLGQSMSFREAEDALSFFSNGACALGDTTIARHTVAIGSAVEPKWLYRDSAKIADLVCERATRCTDTNRPLIYASSDAHSLPRYVNETWEVGWKNVNGLRLWIVDRNTGELIHLGGEYTSGDCHEVARIFKRLVSVGIVRPDGDYGGRERALFVWISDGMPWFNDHILPVFAPENLVVILDAYHVLKRLSDLTKALHRDGTEARRTRYAELANLVTGTKVDEPKAPGTQQMRRGHSKRKPGEPRTPPRFIYPEIGEHSNYAAMILTTLRAIPARQKKRRAALASALSYLEKNKHRIDYAEYRRRGMMIGSGPMEALHRTASQPRTKLPGARWLRANLDAVLNLRMMHLAGNADAFWQRDDLEEFLTAALRRRRRAANHDRQDALADAA